LDEDAGADEEGDHAVHRARFAVELRGEEDPEERHPEADQAGADQGEGGRTGAHQHPSDCIENCGHCLSLTVMGTRQRG
jgi:hypothetical protein